MTNMNNERKNAKTLLFVLCLVFCFREIHEYNQTVDELHNFRVCRNDKYWLNKQTIFIIVKRKLIY